MKIRRIGIALVAGGFFLGLILKAYLFGYKGLIAGFLVIALGLLVFLIALTRETVDGPEFHRKPGD